MKEDKGTESWPGYCEWMGDQFFSRSPSFPFSCCSVGTDSSPVGVKGVEREGEEWRGRGPGSDALFCSAKAPTATHTHSHTHSPCLSRLLLSHSSALSPPPWSRLG